MRLLNHVVAISLLAASAAGQGERSGTPPLSIVDVTVIDGVADTARPDMTVRVVNGLIDAVGIATELRPRAGDEVIDGRGRFLIPGLWDTHAHLSYWGEDPLRMLVEAGVTSIRELGGDPDELEAWKREIEAGERLGPAMVWCGPFLEGPDAQGEYRLTVSDPGSGRAAVRALHERGVDFLKFQPLIDREVAAAVVDEARGLGLTVVGHLPRGLSAIEGSNLGMRSIEHMSPYTQLDDDRLAETFAVYLENGTWMSPALYSLAAPVEASGGDPKQDRRLRRSYAIVRSAFEAGVPILVGSNFAYRSWPQQPGTGLHGEMVALADAGIPPMEVLKLSTSRAAEFCGARDRCGAIERGLSADLVLLDADPLLEMRNISRIAAVILGGRRVK